MNFENLSLAEIVTLHPKAASLFDKMQLDFCCKGKQKLKEAISNDLVKLEDVKTKLEIIINTNDDSLIETIIHVMEAEHSDTGEILSKINKLTNEYTAPESACITFKVCLEELKMLETDIHKHIHLENNILFPKAVNNNNGMPKMCSFTNELKK